MKQQIITGLKKKLLIVELPEGAKDVHINEFYFFNTRLSYRTETSLHFIEIKERLLEDKIKLVGKLTDITENQYQQWVDKFNNGACRNYKDEHPFYPDFDTDNFYLTAKESFFSYLERQEVVFKNPLGEKPVLDKESLWGNAEQDTQVFAALNYQIDKWQEAESKEWKKDQCWLFEIL